MDWVRGVIEGEEMLGVRMDRVKGLIKAEGVLEAWMDRGTHEMRMMEKGEMNRWMEEEEE